MWCGGCVGGATRGAEFLGFSISNDGAERPIAPKALDTFKTRVREQTCRTRGLSLTQIVGELAPYLSVGAATSASARPIVCLRTSKRAAAEECAQFFGCSGEWAQPFQRTAPPWRVTVPGSGCGRFTDGLFWRMSGHPAVQAALRNHNFDTLGLLRLYVPVPT
jgi:RNA-directed DNA polymerase